MRAAQQAVCAAIANNAPLRQLHVISQEFGISVDRLAEGRRHWSEWVGGGRESIMDLRCKVRNDGMDEAWVEFALDVCGRAVRAGLSAKDSICNPNDKADKQLYRVH